MCIHTRVYTCVCYTCTCIQDHILPSSFFSVRFLPADFLSLSLFLAFSQVVNVGPVYRSVPGDTLMTVAGTCLYVYTYPDDCCWYTFVCVYIPWWLLLVRVCTCIHIRMVVCIFMYVCRAYLSLWVCTHARVYVCVCACIQIYTHIHTYTHTRTHTHTHTHLYTYKRTHIHAQAHIHTHTHIHTFTHSHIHTHAHACTHTHTHTHTHAHTHINIQTARFRTTIKSLLLLNPDVAIAAALPVQQDLCLIPCAAWIHTHTLKSTRAHMYMQIAYVYAYYVYICICSYVWYICLYFLRKRLVTSTCSLYLCHEYLHLLIACWDTQVD